MRRVGRVIFHVHRHAQPHKSVQTSGDPLDALTDAGKAHAAQTALALYGDVSFAFAHHSGMGRAHETLQAMLGALIQWDRHLQVEQGFGFTWLTGDPNVPQEDFFAIEAKLAAKNGPSPRQTTVGDWLASESRHIWALRGRVTQSLLDIARRVNGAYEGELETAHVLVISHGPTGASAALDPATMPGLDFCDGVTYVVEFDGYTPRLVSSTFIAAPPMPN